MAAYRSRNANFMFAIIISFYKCARGNFISGMWPSEDRNKDYINGRHNIIHNYLSSITLLGLGRFGNGYILKYYDYFTNNVVHFAKGYEDILGRISEANHVHGYKYDDNVRQSVHNENVSLEWHSICSIFRTRLFRNLNIFMFLVHHDKICKI